MLKYAREDTHYLLNIYDKLRLEIIEFAEKTNKDPKGAILSVLEKSKEMISLKIYAKPKLKNESYYFIIEKNKMMLSDKKFAMLKKLMK